MRLIVADDHPIVLAGLGDLLRRAGHNVLASVRSGDAALLEIEANMPDAALLDVNMPGGTGVDILRTLRHRHDMTPVVLLMGTLEEKALVDAVQLGVEGIVLKESATDMLLRCLDLVAAGSKWIDREAMARALRAMARSSDADRLTQRECEITCLVGQGKRNREIADALHMSEGTVKAHLRNIFEKLEISNRAQLALRARELNLS